MTASFSHIFGVSKYASGVGELMLRELNVLFTRK